MRILKCSLMAAFIAPVLSLSVSTAGPAGADCANAAGLSVCSGADAGPGAVPSLPYYPIPAIWTHFVRQAACRSLIRNRVASTRTMTLTSTSVNRDPVVSMPTAPADRTEAGAKVAAEYCSARVDVVPVWPL